MAYVVTIPGRLVEPRSAFPHPVILRRDEDGTPSLRLLRVGDGAVRIDVNEHTVFERPAAAAAAAREYRRRRRPRERGFPFALTFSQEPDGTHSVHVDTYPGGPHDLDGSPYLRIGVDEATVWEHPVPALTLEHGQGRIPTAVWLNARVGDILWSVTGQIERELGGDLFDYRCAGARVEQWAARLGPLDTVFAREGHCLLGSLLHVVRYTAPEAKPVAIAVYDNGIDAPAGVRAYRDRATAQAWRRFADVDLACRRGHRWQVRGQTVTGPDGVREPAAVLGTRFARPGDAENTAACPVCCADCRALLPGDE